MPGELIVVSGPPGAGKTTVAGLLSDLFDPSVLVTGDDFFGFLRNGRIEPWLPESNDQNTTVIAAAAAACGRYADGGYTAVYDGVVGPWFVDRFLAGTGLERLHYALLMPGEETCVGRVTGRQGHPFTDVEATRRMYRQFADASIAARHRLGEGEPTATADHIRRAVASGELLYPGPDPAASAT